MNDLLLIPFFAAAVFATVFSLSWGTAAFLKKRFDWAWSVWTARVAAIVVTLLLVAAGTEDVQRGLTSAAVGAFAFAFLIAAYWPSKWLIVQWLAAAPQRQQRAEERREHVERQQSDTETTAKRKRVVLDIAQWYEEQKKLLETVPDKEDRDSFLMRLRERYDQLIKAKLEELTP